MVHPAFREICLGYIKNPFTMEAIYYCLQKHEEEILGCCKFSCKGKPCSIAKEAKINNIKNK
jgi:hypothetical protein